MALAVTMGTLVTRCQQEADRENDDHIATAEWKSRISRQYGELHGIVSGTGYRYFETTSTITATGALSYALPSDHLSTVGIARILATSGGNPSQFGLYLREAMAQEEWALAGPLGEARRFAVIGTNVKLYPVPPTGHTYQLRYIAQPTDLSALADGTTVDCVTADGQEFLIWGVASKAKAKSDEQTQFAIGEREASRARLYEWAARRAFHQPRLKYVQDGDDFGCVMDEADWSYNR